MATLRGTSKRDILRGGPPADTLLGLGGNDDLYGNAGNDTAKGGTGNDKLFGGVGNDKLLGEAGNDSLKGDAGNDTLTGGAGTDTLNGGAGTDTAVLATSWLAATITQVAGGVRIAGPAANGTDTAIGVETFKFTNGTFTAAQILNDAPVANTDSGFATNEDTALVLTPGQLLANDTDADTALGDSITLLSVQGAVNGTVQIASGNIVFTPAANFNGAASFTYTVRDAKGLTATATANLTATAVNDAPVAVDDAATTDEDTPLNISLASLLANDTDVDGNTLSITAVSGATGGSVVISGANVVFTPSANFNGTAGFSYTLSDDTLTDTGLVQITVSAVNDAPVATDDNAATAEDTPLNVAVAALIANDTDAEGATLTITAVGNAVNGSVALVAGQVIFTPSANFNGAASFEYTLSDGVLTDTGLVNVTVTAVNDAPTITNLIVTETQISFTASDVEGDAMSLGSTFASVFGNPTVSNGATTTLTVSEQASALSGMLQVGDGTDLTDVIDLFLGTSGGDTENRSAATAAVALYGFGGIDTLTGGSANDYLLGGGGNDALTGNGGSDTYGVDSASDGVTEGLNGGAADTVRSSVTLMIGSHIENLVLTGTANNSGTGNTLPNTITGTSGSGTLTGGDGDDTINLGGNSTVNWDYAYGGNGDDTISGGTGWVHANGEAGNDTIDVSSAGLNTGKYTQVSGGADNDTITGSLGTDNLSGDGGDDSISAGGGNDSINGGLGTDTIDAGAGDDTITSNSGEGPDFIDGGADADYLTLNRSSGTAANDVDFSNPTMTQTLADGTTVVNVERVVFTSGSGDDIITSSNHSGGASFNSVSGGSGADTLTAASNGASLYGEAGADDLAGSGVNDTLHGGDQNDTIDLGGNTTNNNDYAYGGNGDDIIDGAGGWAIAYGEAGNDTLDMSAAGLNTGKYTRAYGGADTDTLTGSLGQDYLDGEAGADTIDAGAGGADVINGGTETDTLTLDRSAATAALTFHMTSFASTTTLTGNGTIVINVENLRLTGGSGSDSFRTLSGDDILDGRGGTDTLEGGGGADRFVLHAALGADTIVDFVAGTDFLRFSTAELGLTSGDLATRLINNTTTASGTTPGPELIFDNTTNTLRYDADGLAGGEVVIAILTGVSANLTAADFDVIA